MNFSVHSFQIFMRNNSINYYYNKLNNNEFKSPRKWYYNIHFLGHLYIYIYIYLKDNIFINVKM
jgi:hypothetical protein